MGEPTAQVSKEALAAAWATAQLGTQDWNQFCERFAEEAYGTRGRFPSAADAAGRLAVRRELQDAQPGQLLYFRADSTNNGYGHVGIYVGGDQMVSATPTGVKQTSVLKDAYYGPRFVGVADAPPDWQGRPATPDLVSGAQKIAAQAAAAGREQGTMTGESATQGVGPGDVFGQYGPPAAAQGTPAPANAKVAEFQRQVQAHQQKLDAARAAKAAADAAFDAHAGKDPFNTEPNKTTSLQRAQRDADEEVRHWRDALGKAQTNLATAQQAADAAAAKVPAASSQYLNTDASDQYILARNPDGTLKMKPDGSGPETIPNPNYRPPADTAASARAASGLYEAQAGAQKTPAQVQAESAAAVAREQAQAEEARARAGATRTAEQVAAESAATVAHEQAATEAEKYKNQRPALITQLRQQMAAGSLTAADATRQLQDYDELAKTTAERLQEQAQAELRRHNQEQEAVARSQQQQGIAALADELGQRQQAGAIFFNRGNPAAQQAAMQVPGAPEDSVGMRLLKRLMPQLFAPGGMVTPAQAAAPATSLPVPSAAPAPLPQRAVDLAASGRPGYAQNELIGPGGETAGLVGEPYAIGGGFTAPVPPVNAEEEQTGFQAPALAPAA